MTPQEGEEFLTKLLNKNLRVQTTDSRLFWGQFRCTDPDANVVLTSTYEYSPASRSKVASTTTATTSSDTQSGNVQQSMLGEMQSRYLGLVVVPGKHIVKIEVEEFLSQLPKTTKKPAQNSSALASSSPSLPSAKAEAEIATAASEVVSGI